jgi:NAD(P)H-dependent flavin oxidoreductase YrpB (nitropropane dioxygenase family)
MTVATLKTRFSSRYEIPYPVVQAGMAFASMTEVLPVAVSEAGGIGTIANVGSLPTEILEHVWQAARRLTSRPLSINLITYYVNPSIIDTIVRLRPLSVSFHWGRPNPEWVKLLKGAGVEVWEQVGSVAEALRAVEDGIDVVIVQGSEAGGHNYGESSLLTLLPAVRDAVGPEPMLLAAGGIVDGRSLVAALMLGADGVWVGTRYLASVESEAHPEWKRRLLSARAVDTCCTHIFGRQDPLFNPIRVLRNKVVEEWNDRIDEAPLDDKGSPGIIGSMELFGQVVPLQRFQNMAPMLSAEGDLDEFPLLSGEGVEMIRDIPTAAEITHRLVAEALTVLHGFELSGVSK